MYTFEGCIHQQDSGGSIALELTGNIAQAFMIWWDHTLKSQLAESVILVRLMKRYVDDVNLAAQEILLSGRCENGKLVIKQEVIEGDLLIAGNKRTMEVMKDIRNRIHPSMGKREGGKMPLLDLEVWIKEVMMVQVE